MQLDIFADSRDVMLRNDVLDALHRRHVGDARQAWQRLAGEFPDDGSLSVSPRRSRNMQRLPQHVVA